MIKKITSIFRQLSIQLILSIAFAILMGNKISVTHVSFFYSISSCFIEILMFFLPFIIFVFMFNSLACSSSKSIFLIFSIFIGVTISNITALTTSYFFSKSVLPYIGISSDTISFAHTSNVKVLFKLLFKNPIRTEYSMITAIVVSMLFMIIKDENKYKQKILLISERVNKKISSILTKIFIPILPLYVFGFCLKLGHDNIITSLLAKYGKIFTVSMILIVMYISILYFIGSGFSLKDTIKNIKIFLPAGLTGFSTMSSAATMPVTISCAEKATDDKNLANLTVPVTSNVHMIGDDLTITTLAMSLLLIFNINWPSFSEFMVFALAFAIAKFSCVGIPGGGVIIILPVLKSHLGFSSEMMSIATTVYVLQDSFMTASNVMGNGAFIIIIKKLQQKLRFKKSIENIQEQSQVNNI